MLWGSLLEIITAAAGIGTAVVLYPVTRRVSRTAAIGFVTSRVVEGAMIMVGVLSVLSVVTLKADFAGATGGQADSLRVTGEALRRCAAVDVPARPRHHAGINALFLGYVMYRGGLVPRIIPTIGLIGAPLLLISSTSTLFGGWAQTSAPRFFFGLPDRRLGVLARRLPHLQGLQAHGTHRRGQRLTTIHNAARNGPVAATRRGPSVSLHPQAS